MYARCLSASHFLSSPKLPAIIHFTTMRLEASWDWSSPSFAPWAGTAAALVDAAKSCCLWIHCSHRTSESCQLSVLLAWSARILRPDAKTTGDNGDLCHSLGYSHVFNSPAFSDTQGRHVTYCRLGNSKRLGGLGGRTAWTSQPIPQWRHWYANSNLHKQQEAFPRPLRVHLDSYQGTQFQLTLAYLFALSYWAKTLLYYIDSFSDFCSHLSFSHKNLA